MTERPGDGRDQRADLLERVFQQCHDAIIVFDPERDEIVEVNPQACSLLDYDRSELLGLSPQAIHSDEHDEFEAFVSRVFDDGEGSTESLSCQRRTGERIPSEIAASVVDYNGRDCVLAMVRDVTERERYVERLEALNRVGRELMRAESRRDVTETVVDVAEDLLDQPLSVVWVVDDERETLTPLMTTSQVRAMVDGDLPTLGPDTFEWSTFEEGESRVVDYVDVSKPGAPTVPLRTTLFVPLGRHGLLSVGSVEPQPLDEGTRHLVEVLAQTATAALEHVERERELRRRTADLTRQNERLAEFASVVSHDLRNPLNVAQGFLGHLDTEDTETVDRIDRALDRMEALIDDVLTLAQQGETVDDVEPVNLSELAAGCWSTTAHGDTELEVSPHADRTLLADDDRVKQLLENLFRNAITHGAAETISVGVIEENAASASAGFYVADDGTGIDDSVRDRLFEPGVSTAQEGTGFGLRIVESIAEAHGWEVSVADSAESGARFEVTGVEWVGNGA